MIFLNSSSSPPPHLPSQSPPKHFGAASKYWKVFNGTYDTRDT